jgi:hypothetical protein
LVGYDGGQSVRDEERSVSEEQSSKGPRWLVATTALGVIGVVIAAILYYGYTTTPGWVGVSDKKFWDYLELLIVPAALAFGVYLLNLAQRERELALQNQRAQDEALQAYLDQMSQLLTDKERPLHRAQPGDNLSVVAWAWTKTVLRRMGRVHKGNVLRFVNEAGLIKKHNPVFHLSGADLHGADLRNSTLTNIDLHGADLSGADLSGADLRGADLRGADLSEAKLNGAILNRAELGTARVSVVLPDGGAEPSEPKPVDLRQADLSQANLQWARGWTHEQLDQAKSLEGATMPDGKQYKVWVKSGWLRQRSRKGRREDGENGGPS